MGTDKDIEALEFNFDILKDELNQAEEELKRHQGLLGMAVDSLAKAKANIRFLRSNEVPVVLIEEFQRAKQSIKTDEVLVVNRRKKVKEIEVQVKEFKGQLRDTNRLLAQLRAQNENIPSNVLEFKNAKSRRD